MECTNKATVDAMVGEELTIVMETATKYISTKVLLISMFIMMVVEGILNRMWIAPVCKSLDGILGVLRDTCKGITIDIAGISLDIGITADALKATLVIVRLISSAMTGQWGLFN